MRLAFAPILALVLLAGESDSNQAFFRDSLETSGIRFRLENSPSAERNLIETITGGCSFLDYDGDGLLDIFLVNGAAIQTEPGKPSRIDKSAPRYWNRLYRNRGAGRFEDVTEKAGVRGSGYGLGVAVADYDNDGRPDLYITNFGGNQLLHNEGDGTFRDLTHAAGVAGAGFSTSAVFFDYDRDGFLDLYVCRYLDWSFENNKVCEATQGRDYCHPREFAGQPGILFHNNGNNTFSDVSTRMGMALPAGKGLGIAVGDLDRDGWPDFYVANDSVPSFLFRNHGGKAFEEIGLSAAAALNENGATFAGMGVDFADYDNDGWPDIFVTALSLEGFPLFRNNRDGTFDDVSQRMGVKKASFYLSGWGTKLFDFDNDGWKDIFVANGHVMRGIAGTIRTLSYAQPLLILRNARERFLDVTHQMGPAFEKSVAARGAAFGDFDNDGDVDILVQVLGGAPLLLENRQGNKKNWLGLELIGTKSNRDAIGAAITVQCDSGVTQHFTVGRGSSYLSSNDPRLVAGLGDGRARAIEIRWPSGRIERIESPSLNRYISIHEKQ